MSLPTSIRSLARTPALALTIVLTLALGTGALTTTFGVVRAALWRQPPFPDAGRIGMLYLERNPQGEAPRRERWSFTRYALLAQSQDVFEQVASYSPGALTVSTPGEGNAELIQGERISASYFPLLRVGAWKGRLFTDSEDNPSTPAPVIVLGHQYWTRRFASDSNIIGRDVRLNGVPLTVIGIMPQGFTGLSGRAELWVPRTLTPQLTYAEFITTNQNFISAVGRLKTGVDFAAARTRLAVLGANINRAIPSDPDFPDERVTATAISLNDARVDRTVRRSLFVVLAAVAVLHLLACVNVINLLLGREASHRHESAVRVALGSSTNRLFRHLLGGGLLLAVAGGALGILLAFWASAVITPPTNTWAPRNFYGSLAPFDVPHFGVMELVFGGGLIVVSAFLVALPPALRAFGVNVSSGIRTGARGIADNAIALRRPSARGIIVSIEAALAMLLVVAAGLLIDSFQRMRQVDIGVQSENLLTFWVIPSEARVPPAAAPAFVSKVIESVAAVPGVQSVSVDGGAPMSGSASTTLHIVGRAAPLPGQAPPILRHYVAPAHFETLGIPVRRGRPFSDRDQAGSPHVVIISETAARRFWPNQDPIGQRVWFSSGSTWTSADSSAEVVGIVGDVVYAPLDQRPNYASFYTPYTQFTYAPRMVFVKTAGDPLSIIPSLRKAIASVDPELAMQEVQPLERVIDASWARHRFDALLFSGFGISALLLAASGIFAVLSYAVATRAREFGIRMALGADARRVLLHVVREGMVFPLVGLVVGVLASLAVTRLLQSSLYSVSPWQPRVFMSTAALLAVVAALACVIPAWRATRVDPSEALRSD
jgi:putative ABC transport system permease protein